MIVGFLSVPLFKFVIPVINTIGVYFEKLDVMLPSVLLAMLAGIMVSKRNQLQINFNRDKYF